MTVFPGTSGDDVFVISAPASGDQYNGGTGNDSVQLAQPPLILTNPFGSLWSYSFAGLTFSSIEKLDFSQAAGQTNSLTTFTNQYGSGFVNNLQLLGAAGADKLIIVATAAGTYTMPTFTKTNWTADTSIAGLMNTTDMVVLFGSSPSPSNPINFTLNATDIHTGIEALVGGTGNDTLNGGSSQDYLIVSVGNVSSTGTDVLNAGGGDDFLLASNQIGQFNTFATTTFNGGTGNDTLVIAGDVYFNGSGSSIERLRLLPAVAASGGSTGFADAHLSIDESIADQFDIAEIEGTGTLSYFMETPGTFDSTAVTIVPGSSITLEVYGTAGNDTIITGSSDDVIFGDWGNDTISGGAGDDYLSGEDGDDILTGGSGNDIFAASYGNDVVMDFVVGQDTIEVPDVIANFNMLQPFLHQSGNDTVLSFVYNGVQNSMTLKNVSLASLDQNSFVSFGAGDSDPGTANDDVYFGTNFGDFFDGLGGNDLIFAGSGGPDQILGGSGNDTVVVTASQPSPSTPFVNSSFDGGTGTDILRISSFGTPSQALPPVYSVNFASTTVTGFEQIQFQGNAGSGTQAIFLLPQITTNLAGVTVDGSAGGDALIMVANAAGTFAMPNITRTNWNTDLTPYTSSTVIPNSDVFTLVAGGNTGSTLSTNLNHTGIEALIGSSGNDILNGGNDVDFLNPGANGADQLFGGGGTDMLLVSQGTSQGNFSDDVYDGGTGTDYLRVSGAVTFAGTLTSMEGIWLNPATIGPSGVQTLADAQLTLDAAHAAAFGANALIRGKGGVIVNGTSSGTIDLSGWQFETPPIIVTINGSTGNDTIIGTSHADTIDGGDGDDRIYWDGTDTNLQGGAGTDRLVLSTGVADPVGFDLYGHGFEYLERETLDTGNANGWSRISDVYTVGTNLKTEQFIYWDDGTSSYVDLDEAGNQAFTQVVNARDAQGLTLNQTISWDDGTNTAVTFDADGSQAYTQILNAQDSQGHTLNQQISWDDSTSTFVTFDALSNQTYDHIINFQNAQGQTANQQIFWDDGTNTFVLFDADGSQAYSQILNAQDSQNRTLNQQVSWDDGTKTFVTFDYDNTQNYTQITNFVDTQSRLDNQLINYDDGSKTFIDYDELNTQAWSQHIIEYDTDGTTILRDYLV